jgi:peptidoglycan/xylan/chitin deacetylase (PgdA/CDA1 family)
MKQKEATNEIVNKDFYLVKTPWWVKKLYPDCVWDMPEKNKTLYLSFDDGPHPTITPFVLKLLKQYNAKASFFASEKMLSSILICLSSILMKAMLWAIILTSI